MPIAKKRARGGAGVSRRDLFPGRVIRVETHLEVRGWTDPDGRTDFRTTECTYALVWLGPWGIPPRVRDHRPMVILQPPRGAGREKDLEFYEQFGWVDCTSTFPDADGSYLEPSVDGPHGSFGDPLMWTNLIGWEAYWASLLAEDPF